MHGNQIHLTPEAKKLARNEQSKAYHRSHKVEENKRNRAYARTPRGKYNALKSSAAYRGYKVTFSFEVYRDLILSPCFYCGGTLPEAGSGLDRQDHTLDYIEGNCVPCCWDCNCRKGYLEKAGFRYPETIVLLLRAVGIVKSEEKRGTTNTTRSTKTDRKDAD